MRTGVSLTIFTLGAILGLAVHVDTSVVNLNLIGLILMLVAVIGFALSPAALSIQRRTTITQPTDNENTTETVETTERETVETVDHPAWARRAVDGPERPAEHRPQGTDLPPKRRTS